MQRVLRVSVVMCLILCMTTSFAGCLVTSQTCIDPGATRIIDGIPVTRDCWGYEEEKTCLKPDTGINGCKTLAADEENIGPGGCKRITTTCEESVTDVDGKTVCLKESAVYRCDRKIELPLLNAAWTGVVTESFEVAQSNTCGELGSNAACAKTEEKREGNILTQTYSCSDETLSACTDLVEKGCTRLKKPACDAEADPSCTLKVGRVRCTTDAYMPYLKTGLVTVESVEQKADSKAEKDTRAIGALENATTRCEVISSVCTDDKAGWRVVNGSRVYAACWAYKETVRCRDTEARSTCEALQNEARCRVTDEICEETIDGVCVKKTFSYTCDAPSDAIFEEGAEAAGEITFSDGLVASSACGDLESDGACRRIGETCETTDPETGQCLKRRLTYACGKPGESVTTNDCEDLESDETCRLEGTECTGFDESGACTMQTRRYVCREPDETIALGEVCDETVCAGGVCQSREEADSEGFLQSAALLEIAREAASYADAGKGTVFEGTASGCTVKAAGFSCCKRANAADAAGFSNSGFEVALTVGVDAGLELIKTVGSPYVYDVLTSHDALSPLLTSLYGEAGSGVYSPDFSFYGVSVGTDAAGSLTLNFSPAGFFAAVAMRVLTDYFSCTKEDQLHALREAAGLCRYVGSFCAKKSGAGCLEKKETWVCFNSRLARLVQEGARRQLNLGWGTPEEPLTRGITFEELRSLDFTRIDLTAAVAEVARVNAEKLTGKGKDPAATLSRTKERVKTLETSDKPYAPYSTVTGKCYTASGYPTHCASVTAVPSGRNQ